MKSPIPPPRTHLFGLRAENTIPKIKFNTTCYRDSFYPHSIKVWNNIGSEFRNIASLSLFKANIFKLVRPSRKSLIGLHDSSGIKRPLQLRVGLSPLKFHRSNHNFQDAPSDTCDCSSQPETLDHHLLQCITFTDARSSLMYSITPILHRYNLLPMHKSLLNKLLLYGPDALNQVYNLGILATTLKYIKDSDRFTLH